MSRYVPPHLRGQQNTSSNASNNNRQEFVATTNPVNTGERRFNTYNNNNNRGGGGGGNRNYGGGYNRQQQGFSSKDSYSSRGGGGGYSVPQRVAWYLEKHPLKSGGEQPSQQSTFSRWDIRNQGKPSPLGFHGSTSTSQFEEEKLFGSQHSTGINFDKYDDIPVETSGRDVPPAVNSFSEAEIPERLKQNLVLCKYTKPTPVQKYSIPIGIAGRDLMACAQTGSGKTGGFLFPIISLMLTKGALVPEPENRYCSFPNAVILSPTRELAIQIVEEASKFTYATGIRSVVVYGGAESKLQFAELRAGCDLLVGTPGRLIDFLERGNIMLSCVQQLVLDEADRMLDMGFEPSIRRIVEEFDMPKDRITFMFSATFPKEIQRLAGDFMRDYVFLTVGRVGSAAKDITQTIEHVEDMHKRDALEKTLSGLDGSGLVLVFCETKRGADYLEQYLRQQGFPTTSIHGDRSQRERELALDDFKTGTTPILIATDVAARGLDIDNVTVVINYDLPSNIDDYVHRIGRTGRAGNKGTALSFFSEKNMNIATPLLQLLEENSQQVPLFLRKLGSRGGSGVTNYSSSGQRRGGGGGNRDYRSNVTRSRGNAVAATGRGGGASSGASRPQATNRPFQRSGGNDAW